VPSSNWLAEQAGIIACTIHYIILSDVTPISVLAIIYPTGCGGRITVLVVSLKQGDAQVCVVGETSRST
jgi:hypothetical protein